MKKLRGAAPVRKTALERLQEMVMLLATAIIAILLLIFMAIVLRGYNSVYDNLPKDPEAPT